MVRIEYTRVASPSAMSFCSTPMARPPSRLMMMMTMPQMASPFTNFMAPSRLP